MRPLVTIVMPAYNVAPYVGDAIRSVVNQTYPRWELMAVDDGSADGSIDVIRSFRDDRIKPIRLEPNQGVAAARNRAITEGRGDYFALLDADDTMDPTRLERQVRFMEHRQDVALSGGWCGTMAADGTPGANTFTSHIDPRAVNPSLVFGNVFCTSSLMMRRNAVPEGGFRQQYAEDYDLLVRVAEKHRLAIMEEILVHYRLRPGSAMRTYALDTKTRDVWQSQQPLFKALGITPSEEERDIHLFARTNEGNVDGAQLRAISRWYEKLVEANRQSGRYPDHSFRLAASYMLFAQLFRATGCGVEALRTYFGKSMSREHPQPFILWAKFMAKAAIGREFAKERR
ncbi:MAG TPA: glycosyltransferase family 2 protein [Rhodocyclaceae bacterium]|nr:glycosyltransferase family 2 protein [Rhodocyclaceae bacterium]